MKKTVSQELPPTLSTSKGSKQELRAAYSRLEEAVFDLVSTHLRYAKKVNKSPPKHPLGIQATDFYTHHIQEVLDFMQPLGDLLNLKQAGGPKRKSHLEVTYRLLTAHYIETEKVLTAPTLVKKYNLEVYGERYPADKNGNEPLSEKVAREDIRFFKLCLPHEDFYRN